MSNGSGNVKLVDLLRRYTPAGPELDPYQDHSLRRDTASLHLLCIPALMFATLGILFTINFGLSLIVIALAILYYARFGRRIAAEMTAVLLLMLATWMLLMPAHHLVAASLVIFVLALAGQVFGKHTEHVDRSLASIGRQIIAGPVYALVAIRKKLIGHRPGLG